jgi:hypothetical protein
MKKFALFATLCLLFSCTSSFESDPVQYHQLINEAELLICDEKFAAAHAVYEQAFQQLEKPFGKDVFNAALCSAYSGNTLVMKEELQLLLNNMADPSKVYTTFVGKHLSVSEWEGMMQNREIDYDSALRAQMQELWERDQLFRPDYDNYDDTINANRKINLAIIRTYTAEQGLPSHFELGYPDQLRKHPHYIVLHHSAQRRSSDKSVLDLEPMLREAVFDGRMDPELAIQYLAFQNDPEKGAFDPYTTLQVSHPLLPDSLAQRRNLPFRTAEELSAIDATRQKWLANSTSDIAQKTAFLEAHKERDFFFSSVNTAVYKLAADVSAEEAVQMYEFLNRVDEMPGNPGGTP